MKKGLSVSSQSITDIITLSLNRQRNMLESNEFTNIGPIEHLVLHIDSSLDIALLNIKRSP